MYIDIDQEILNRATQQSSLGDNQVIAILGQDENGETVQVEVVNQAELRAVTGVGDNINISDDIHIEMQTPDGRVQTITVAASSLTQGGVVTSLTNSKAGSDRRRQHSGRGHVGGSPGKKSCNNSQVLLL